MTILKTISLSAKELNDKIIKHFPITSHPVEFNEFRQILDGNFALLDGNFKVVALARGNLKSLTDTVNKFNQSNSEIYIFTIDGSLLDRECYDQQFGLYLEAVADAKRERRIQECETASRDNGLSM